MKTLRVLSYNIHKGTSDLFKKKTISEMKQAIRFFNADLGCFQEVMGDSLEQLADSIWTSHAYGRNAVYESGDHGNAILSRYPIKNFCNTDISLNRLERRGILHATLDLEQNQTIHVITVHLNLLEYHRQKQLRLLIEYVRSKISEHEPLIIAGDFNDWRFRAGVLLKTEIGMDDAHHLFCRQNFRTFPARFPVLCLDRIYCKNIKVNHADVGKTDLFKGISDHLPLFAEFEIPTRS